MIDGIDAAWCCVEMLRTNGHLQTGEVASVHIAASRLPVVIGLSSFQTALGMKAGGIEKECACVYYSAHHSQHRYFAEGCIVIARAAANRMRMYYGSSV